ncbi:MAG TPA: hypothetical protein VNA24_18250 [Hyalangium sp.]|nr:hypothetical protein [Hyalangium sp.]
MKRLLPVMMLFLASPAWSDMPPPDVRGCYRKALGAACVTDRNVPGTCMDSLCSEYDGYNYDPPRSFTVDCVQCVTPEDASVVATNTAAWHRERTIRKWLFLGLALSLATVGVSWVHHRGKQR